LSEKETGVLALALSLYTEWTEPATLFLKITC